MSPDELNHFRALLESIREDLHVSLAHADPAEESIKPDSAIGRLTRIEAIQAQSMTAEGRRRQESRLQQVERAGPVLKRRFPAEKRSVPPHSRPAPGC